MSEIVQSLQLYKAPIKVYPENQKQEFSVSETEHQNHENKKYMHDLMTQFDLH